MQVHTITLVGLGNMGQPMAASLVKAGFCVQGYDIHRSFHHKRELEKDGILVCESLAQALAGADCMITMLPSAQEVLALYDEASPHIKPETLLIDCSTVSVSTVQVCAEKAKRLESHYLEAPVSGGISGAKAAKLTFICGGEPHVFEKAEPVLQAMGQQIFHVGLAGSGQAAKMCNNMLLAISMIGTSEAIHLGQKFGLDPKKLSDIMRSCSGNNWVLENYNPCPNVLPDAPASHQYKFGFTSTLMNKDLNIALNAAQQKQLVLPMANTAQAMYLEHTANGHGHHDFSSIFKAFSNAHVALIEVN
jgi:3-hydroxyisobutyrate dehydrogenase